MLYKKPFGEPKFTSTVVQEHYEGDVLHSVDYSSADQWRGKAGIVVGTANTGE